MMPLMLVAKPNQGPNATTEKSVRSGREKMTKLAGTYASASTKGDHGERPTVRASAEMWSAVISSASGVKRQTRESPMMTATTIANFFHANFAVRGLRGLRGLLTAAATQTVCRNPSSLLDAALNRRP